VTEIFQQAEAIHLGEIIVGLVLCDAGSDFDGHLFEGDRCFEWREIAGSSQLTIVCWCCSTRRIFASARRMSLFIMRAVACEKRIASSLRAFP